MPEAVKSLKSQQKITNVLIFLAWESKIALLVINALAFVWIVMMGYKPVTTKICIRRCRVWFKSYSPWLLRKKRKSSDNVSSAH